MAEPRRWLDADSDAPEGARALLALAAPAAELPLPARARVRHALQAQRAGAGATLLTLLPSGALWATALGAVLALGMTLTAPTARLLPPSGGTAGEAAGAVAWASTRVETGASAGMSTRAGTSTATSTTTSTSTSTSTGAAPSGTAGGPSEALLERWRQQRWANQKRRSQERIAAIVDDVLKPDAQLLERAAGEVGSDPARALALIEAFRKQHPAGEIPAPTVVVEVDALRRLGRFEEALDRARTFVEASHKDYYADEMRERFAFLEL